MIVGIALSLMGFVDINPRIFAENFAYFLTVVAGLYFIFLYFFAGLDAAERKNITLLFLLFIAAAAFGPVRPVWRVVEHFARDYTDLVVSGFEVPVSWIQFVNPIFVVIFAPMFAAVWAQQLGAILILHCPSSSPLA